jgi:hypothetical protein
MSDQNTFEATTTPRATRRDRLAAGTLWLPVVAISVTATLWYRRLPGELPMQWSGGEVSSTAGTEILIGITGMLALLGALAGLVVLSDAAADIRRGLVLAAGFVAGLAAGLWLVPAGLVIATGSAEPDAGAWPLLAVLGCGYGLIPFLMSPRRPHDREPTRTSSPATVPLGATETGAWFTTVTVPLFLWLAGIMALTAVGLAIVSVGQDGVSRSVAVTLALVTCVCLAFARLRVSVDRRGLRVVSSLFRLPIKQVALTEVASARSESIRPLEWGGWGYRIMPGRSAVVLTSGPAIVVERHNGTLFAVTVPQPDLPAALLTTLAAR